MSSYARPPCGRCGEPWSASAFYERILWCCKECHRARVNLRRADPAVRAKDQERADRRRSDPNTPPQKRDRKAAILRTDKWRRDNPEKARAIDAVAHAISNFDLERRRCERCGTDKHVCAFHDDYSKPLKVNWRCRRCHSELRRQAAASSSSDQAVEQHDRQGDRLAVADRRAHVIEHDAASTHARHAKEVSPNGGTSREGSA